MEHAASERPIDRIDAFLGHPSVDPHGDPIPTPPMSSLKEPEEPLARLPARPEVPGRPGRRSGSGISPLPERMRGSTSTPSVSWRRTAPRQEALVIRIANRSVGPRARGRRQGPRRSPGSA